MDNQDKIDLINRTLAWRKERIATLKPMWDLSNPDHRTIYNCLIEIGLIPWNKETMKSLEIYGQHN